MYYDLLKIKCIQNQNMYTFNMYTFNMYTFKIILMTKKYLIYYYLLAVELRISYTAKVDINFRKYSIVNK